MILPVRNATLLSIAGGGTKANFDRSAGAPVTKWEGQADATHTQETLDQVTAGPGRSGGTSGAALDELVRTRLAFDAGLAGVVPGDTVTYRHDGATHSRKVLSVSEPDVLGVVRVTLVDG